MSVKYTDERMNAITRMLDSGESIIYACGMFSTPINKYKLWVASLSADIAIHSLEKSKEIKHEATTVPARGTQQTKGHLQGSGGVRGHSAGDIFPLIVMVVGSFKLGFSYHIIGNGLKMGEKVCQSYTIAHNEARLMVMGAP